MITSKVIRVLLQLLHRFVEQLFSLTKKIKQYLNLHAFSIFEKLVKLLKTKTIFLITTKCMFLMYVCSEFSNNTKILPE